MMKKIYFTRHGQTFWNVENKICGATDIGLTENGKKQADRLGEIIRAGDYHIDEILCSPLIRAKETAECIAAKTGIPCRIEPRLIEQNFGRFEGTARNGEEFRRAKGNVIDSYGGGETMLHLAARIYNLLDELKNDDKVYLLAAHNGISRVIRSYFYDMTNEEYAAYGIGNCDVIEFEYKGATE